MLNRRLLLLHYARYVFCVVFALWSLGCASYYTDEGLHALNHSAEIVPVCVIAPTVDPHSLVWAHHIALAKSVSDVDRDAFEEFAETADIFYRYDPNAPHESAQHLPWPYNEMSCTKLSSPDTPPLPKGLYELPISQATREALVASLTRKPQPWSPGKSVAAGSMQKLFVGQPANQPMKMLPPQFEPVPEPKFEDAYAEQASHILRDFIRSRVPTVQRDTVSGPSSERISIIDTKTGQIVGGFAAGAVISFVLGGAPITDMMVATGQLPQPTQYFVMGKAGGEVVGGLVQVIVGGAAALGGGGASLTGGGAFVGAPVCIAGVALAANGAITFYNGAKTLVLAVCYPQRLPGAPLLAATASGAGGGGGPTTTNAVKDGKVVTGQVETPDLAVAAELKPYKEGGGHHVPAKKAFEGAPGYDLNKAPAIPKAVLEQELGRDIHPKITGNQLKKYKEFATTGQPLTWEVIAKIETEALAEVGMPLDKAKATVAKAIQMLKDQGVAGPVRTPWKK